LIHFYKRYYRMFSQSPLLAFLPSLAVAQFAYQLPTDADLTLTSRVNPTFTCDGRPYGYYADQGNNCELFHICLPIPDQTGGLAQTLQYSYACPNTTIFDQASLTCNYPEYSVPCSEAASFYGYVEFGKREGRSGRLFDGATGGQAEAVGAVVNNRNSNSNHRTQNINNDNFVSIQDLPFLNVQSPSATAQGPGQRRQAARPANRRAGAGGRGRGQRRNN